MEGGWCGSEIIMTISCNGSNIGNGSGFGNGSVFGNGSDQPECVEYLPPYDFEFIQRVLRIVVPLSFGMIGIIGLVGNLLVVTVVLANPGMRSPTNILIMNLAVADLLFVLFCIPFTATDFVLPYWPFGDAWCRIVQYLITVTACASVWTLVLMSLDRCMAVVRPIASRNMRTDANAFRAICIAWVVILVGAIPVLIIHGENAESECRILSSETWPRFQIPFCLLSYVIPVTLICGLYIRMLLALWGAERINTSAENRRGKRRATRLVIVIVAVFTICWLPLQVIYVLKSLGCYRQTTARIMIQIASHVLAYTNSCVNPILYAFLCEHFRRAFRRLTYIRPKYDTQNQFALQTRTTRAASSENVL